MEVLLVILMRVLLTYRSLCDPLNWLPYINCSRLYKPTMVMTAHVVNKHLEVKEYWLHYRMKSSQVITRNHGYDGVVISDDLQMQAIANHY